MDANLLPNLAAYSAQLACIVVLGGVLARLIRIDAAAVRYAWWRALLALCLVLPWVQGRRTAGAADAGGSTVSAMVTNVLVASGEDPATDVGAVWLTALATLLIAGIVLRLMWTGVSLLHLRRLRQAGREAPPGDHVELQRAMGTQAGVRYVAGLGQPVTFGVVRPLVLLPESLRDQAADIRRAVLCHELLHVKRRDWAWVVTEELVCAAFWFHPAVWWLVARVQLAREEVVDQQVVFLTGARRAYLQALLAFSDDAQAPAAAFGRRRHLFRRMVLISREAAMSSKRIVLSCVVMALAVLAGSWMTVGAFPMRQDTGDGRTGPGPVEQRVNAITPENPVPRRVYSIAAPYPAEATSTGVRANVRVRITIDASGRVAEARSLGAFAGVPGERRRELEEAFVASALGAVRQWQYDPPAEPPISFTVDLDWQPDAEATLVSQDTGPARPMAEHAGAAPALPTPAWHAGAVRVGQAVKPPAKIKDVRPVYPPEAMGAGVQGVVILEARIEEDGRVSHTRVLRSVPGLDQAALDAVQQWEFAPAMVNGEPTAVIMTITVQFSLAP